MLCTEGGEGAEFFAAPSIPLPCIVPPRTIFHRPQKISKAMYQRAGFHGFLPYIHIITEHPPRHAPTYETITIAASSPLEEKT